MKLNEQDFKRYYTKSQGIAAHFDNLGYKMERCDCGKKECKGWTLSFKQ